ncbi:MAG: type II toxin-antitoxin system RnlB family antitoxin [Ureaplasma sp.]|nr:type II toxin-antitoxin system RnlB family antitoxin [Ureaplasma sp.]
MKKYLEFIITKIDDSRYYLVYITDKGINYFQKKIEKYLAKQNFIGDLYIDQLCATYPGYNRFAKIPFANNKLDLDNAEHLDLGIEYKQLSSDMFYNNPELLGKYSYVPHIIREKFANNEPA